MSGWLSGIFGGGGLTSGSTAEVPAIYTLGMSSKDFVRADVLATYRRILTDTCERTHGLKDEQWRLLWDSCVQTDSAEGLVTLLAAAMTVKAEIFIVYIPSVEVLRVATNDETRQIIEDYKKSGASKVGVWVSFKNYGRTDLLNVYSEMEYCVIASLFKTVNLAKAVQLKMHEMRSSVSLTDGSVTIEQAKSIASALRTGKDVMLDAKDEVTTSTPDVGPTEKAIAFLDAKRAFHLSLPMAYISGVQSSGIGSTGDADARAVDRGLKQYFASIIQPVFEAVFGIDVVFRPEDTRQVESGLAVIKAFELVSDQYLSAETKREIVARAFDVDPSVETKRLETEAAARGSDTTLNGAQVTAMSAFLEQLAAGSLAPDTAVAALMISFAMSKEDAQSIVNPMAAFKKPAAALPPAPPPFGGR